MVVDSSPYRPPKQNKTLFFEEISSSLSHNVNKYDNYIIAGGLNVNMLDPKCDGNGRFSDLTDTYNLSDLVKSAACLKSTKGRLLHVLLTNKSKAFKRPLFVKLG